MMGDNNDDDLSAAIRNFISGQQQHTPPPTPPQQETQPEPEPEPVAEPTPQHHHHQHQQQQQPQPRQHPTPSPRPTPRQPENNKITFMYGDDEGELPENEATPTAVADYFELDRNEIQLTRNRRTFDIHPTEDRFIPNIRAGRTYTVTINRQQQQQPSPNPRSRRHREEMNSNECTLIANNQRKNFSAGAIRRAVVVSTFGLGRHVNEITLIEEDGSVIRNQLQYTLRPGATYHVVYNDQDHLENVNDDDHDDTSEIFSKPLSLMPPFMVAVVRILYALSFTGDNVSFSNNSEPKVATKLLCSNKLSTCSYQVAYRFNVAIKAIQNLVSMVAPSNREDDQPLGLFDNPNDSEYFCGTFSNVVELLKKAHIELEELLNIVLSEMRSANSSVESVKISLKVEENQEKRTKEKEDQKNNDKDHLTEKCEAIFNHDEEILPDTIDDLDKISCNRKILNIYTKLVEKILDDLNATVSPEDVTNLLNFCAKVSHNNLMHWIFACNLFQHLANDFDATSRNSVEYRRKSDVTKKLSHALRFWEIVSHGVSLPINMNESVESIHDHWNELKDSIITSQYALEVCYFEQD